MHILTNISKSKGNQAMEFGQLIEHNMETFFLENHTQIAMEILFPDPFLKNQNWAYLWIKRFTQIVFTVNQVEDNQNILTPNCRLLAFTSYKAFLKNKKRSGTSLLPHFVYDFWRKIFLSLYSITWRYFIVWLPLHREILFANQTVTDTF